MRALWDKPLSGDRKQRGWAMEYRFRIVPQNGRKLYLKVPLLPFEGADGHFMAILENEFPGAQITSMM